MGKSYIGFSIVVAGWHGSMPRATRGEKEVKNGVIIQEKHSQPNWEIGNLLVFILAGAIKGWYIVSFISAGCSVGL